MAGRKTTTKRDIIKRIAAKTKTPLAQTRDIVQQFLAEVTDELARGGRLEFRDFGVFKAVRRKGREAFNPVTKKPVSVPDQVVAKFVPGRRLRELLLRLDPATLDDGKATPNPNGDGHAGR